ncbi:hypothetical protein TEA_013615 [Camellia sinensis var. sinensis]|uniref:Uncharacterized protein n=1 Tax=Camellia sinensis var. sinensis TaxID=542762 RepID=A0A4S4DPV6_CAMSN|nr:hypothetical protein TEA_013615 [Camellia sinensis var. sinensis]
MNPLARSIEELLPVRISSTFWCFILLRAALVISSVIVAFLVPFFSSNSAIFMFSKNCKEGDNHPEVCNFFLKENTLSLSVFSFLKWTDLIVGGSFRHTTAGQLTFSVLPGRRRQEKLGVQEASFQRYDQAEQSFPPLAQMLGHDIGLH